MVKIKDFFKIQWATGISSGPLMAKFMLWIIMGSGGKGVLPGEIWKDGYLNRANLGISGTFSSTFSPYSSRIFWFQLYGSKKAQWPIGPPDLRDPVARAQNPVAIATGPPLSFNSVQMYAYMAKVYHTFCKTSFSIILGQIENTIKRSNIWLFIKSRPSCS